MVAGGEATPPPHPTSPDACLGLSYSVEMFQMFEDRMRVPEWRQNMLDFAVSDGEVGWKTGQNVARLIEGGMHFQEAMLQVGAQLAAGISGAPVKRDVVEWVKEVMFPLGSVQDVAGHGGVSTQSGKFSGRGDDAQSWQIKKEAMAILEHGVMASSIPTLSHGSTVVSILGAGPSSDPNDSGGSLPPVCDNATERAIVDSVDCGSKIAGISRLGEMSHDVKKQIVVEGGDLSMMGTKAAELVEKHDRTSNPLESNEIPVAPMVLGTQSTVDSVGGIAEELEPSCEFIQNAAKRCMIPVCGNANVGSAVDLGGKLHGVASPRTILGGPAAVCAPVEESGNVCSNPSLKSGVPAALGVPDDRAVPGEVVAHGDLMTNLVRFPPGSIASMIGGVAVPVAPSPITAGDLDAASCGDLTRGNSSITPSAVEGPHGLPPVAELTLAQEFRPPTPGVKLQDWVRVAKDKRRGKKSGAFHAVVPGEPRSIAAALPSAFAEPFPPLSNGLGSNVGLAGSSSAADGMLGGNNNGNQKLEGEVNKFSWSDLLRTHKPTSMGVDLHFVEPTIIDGESCAVFSVEEEAENMLNWQHTLLCYVVGKSPSYYQFAKTVQRLWKCPSVEVFMRENGLFYCRFACEEDLCRVIKDGPWYMEGKLIVVKKFGGATNCEEDMLSCIPIWVKLPCLPVKWWSISGVSKVVSPIGHPLYFDIPSASQSRIAYARCCVEVAMEKPLPSFVTCIGGDKVRRRQKILYDWVPKKCSRCMAFGHLGVDCQEEKNKEMPKVQKEMSQGNVRIGGQHSGAPKNNVQKSDLGSSKENAKESVPMQIIVEHGGCAKSKSANTDDALPLCIEEVSPHCSDDEVAPSSVGVSQHLVSGDEGDTDNGSERSDWDRISLEDPIGVGDEVGFSILPCNKKAARVEGNEIGSQGGVDPLNQENVEAELINNKKAKRIRKRPAPVRPAGSRTTRHSGFVPTT